ncbi:CHAT domain-containing protein [Micromonospora purpureochromogenes]|uniref:CHAT domain-containing protein n=1 Tax=Micromonospora purpureochromogenes TaxID=47872 RepID=A0A1C4UAE9_9ACTN|nr:CHAT domain-containing protein [Micromonospora purpureochromogenes]SCE68663.1 CHAT domain-containing protein [Micromonospora purpureochromogenes]
MQDSIERLRDELSRVTGPARLPKLTQLGQALATNYWRTGPGRPAALGLLSAAIEAWDEAYRLVDPGDPARGQVAVQLGWLLSARHSAHGSGPRDRDTGIFVLTEATRFTNLPPMQAAMARIALGQLHLARATEAMSPAAARSGFLGGGLSGAAQDADEAARLFRELLAGPVLSTDVTSMVRTMLVVAESIHPLLGGDVANFDLSRIIDAMSRLQDLQRNGLPINLWNQANMADPLDYPVTVMRGDGQSAPVVPPRRPTPATGTPTATAAATSTQPAFARRVAREQLAALALDRERPVWEQALTMLLAGPDEIEPAALDAFVGATASAVDAQDGGDPVELGLDRLLSVVGLCLRERRDGSGWDDEDAGGDARRVAARHLLAAMRDVPPGHPAAVTIVEAAGGLLDETRPLSGAIAEIADDLLSYAERIESRPPVVSALAELCRTVTALHSGSLSHPDPLAAVAALPAGHPWRGPLGTAAAHARLAAAVHNCSPAAGSAGSGGDLTAVLDALLRHDPADLRMALDAAADRSSPPTRAVLAAARLRLGDDPDRAITLLAGVVRLLDEGGLRTRTWWRLAEAYRRRGAAGDTERCRDAGRNALDGPDVDPADAARFAGWMLAEGRGAEAFTALEIAAVAPKRAGADSLTRDVLAVLVGVVPPEAPIASVPTPAEVAAAVREIGAGALLYVHSTDDAGLTAGVLCLDPATGQLDVLANLPVTDPLVSDDPGWPAILGRWTAGRLLVAATGGLSRVGLGAVCAGDGRRLGQQIGITDVPSGTHVVRLAARSVPPLTDEPVFVVNPRGDRDAAMAEVMVLRRLFYPRSVCLGRALEPVDAVGGPEDVRKHLAAASVLHLACGLDGTALQLAGGEVLDLASVSGARGLVVLSAPGGSDLVPALLDVGFTGVIGWRWAVPASFAALALFLVHLELVDGRRPPAEAVGVVQRWMLDPDRIVPPYLPGAHLSTVTATDLTRPALWAALAYSGR